MLEEINLKYLAQLHLSIAAYSKFSQTSANNGKTYLKLKAYNNGLVTSSLQFPVHQTVKNLSSSTAIYKQIVPF